MVLRQRGTKQNVSQAKHVVEQTYKVKHLIKQAQTYMLSLVDKLDYKPFDNSVTPDDCIDRLVAHRITSKFHVEDRNASAELTASAFKTYIEYDSGLNTEICVEPRTPLSRARSLLHEWFRDFELDLTDVDYQVTPGSTYIPTKGHVSLEAKLFDVRHWTTTANCLEETVIFIYNHASFKRAARQHIRNATKCCRKERRKLYLRFRNYANTGFRVFRQLLIDHVLTIVDGARASTVGKNNKQRRFINIEAMFPVILQRVAANVILRTLKRVGNDLGNIDSLFEDYSGIKKPETSAQKLHGLLIQDPRYATIDFRSASDSVTVAAVKALFPKSVVDYLMKVRSHYVVVDGVFVEPKKLSSMGNGFTFEVMTIMLYAIASAIIPGKCRVYGDDVIIPSLNAAQFVDTCKLIDFRVNESKTFIDSFFRESCGYFYSSHHGYVTSYDFNQILSFSDVIITHNKLQRIIAAGQVSESLKELLIKTRDQLNALAHASRKGPIPASTRLSDETMSLYMHDAGYDKKQRRSKELRTLFNYYVEKNGWHFKDCQLEVADFSLVCVPFFKPTLAKHLFTDARGANVLLPALYSGGRMKSTVRGEGEWINVYAFVSKDGTVTLLSNLLATRKSWTNRLDGVICDRIEQG